MQWWSAVLIALGGAGMCVLIDYLALVVWPRHQPHRDEQPAPSPPATADLPSLVRTDTARDDDRPARRAA